MSTPITRQLLTALPKDAPILRIFPRLQEASTQSFMTLILTLAAVSIFGFFAISPTLGTIADLQKQLGDNQFVDQELQQKIANLSSLQKTYAQIQDDLPVVLAAIPATNDMAAFIAQIQALVQKDNVTLVRIQTFPIDISSGVAPTSIGYSSYAFSVEVSGSYKDTLAFITSLGNFNRLVTVDSLSVAKTSVVDDSERVAIKGKTYYKSL